MSEIIEVIISGEVGPINLVAADSQFHNQSPDLQGGTTGEYYHLTSGQYAFVTGIWQDQIDPSKDIIFEKTLTASGIVTSTSGFSVAPSSQAKSNHYATYCTTSNASLTEMFLNNSTGRILIPSGTLSSFKGQISAFDVANSKAACWDYSCLAANKNGTTSLVGPSHVLKIGDDSSGVWQVYVGADDTYDSLKLQVKGQVSSTIKWTASVITTVVS